MELSNRKTTALNKDFVSDAFSGEEAVSIFAGEWASKIPGYQSGGAALLFDDDRINWLEQQADGFEGKSVLELGPMEGGHTYMLWKAGASPIIAIEGNKRSYLKCLITKELLGYSAKILLGDFSKFLETTTERYDFILASGVLYHMADPIRLLESLSRVSDRVGIWTQYYDDKVIFERKDLKKRFDIPAQQIKWRGHAVLGYRQKYHKEPNLLSYIGGNLPYSTWLRKEDIIKIMETLGYRVVIGNDDPKGKNGPNMLLYANRQHPE